MSRQLINDPMWVRRMEQYFGYIDQDHNGTITIEEIQQWASNMEVLCKATPNDMVKLRAQLYIFWGNIGLKRDILMTKTQFVKGVNLFGTWELRRKKCGVVTHLEKVHDAYFDVIDTDNRGRLSLRRLKRILIETSMNSEGANAWLKHLDKNKSGEIDRERFINFVHNFWYKKRDSIMV